MKTFNHVCYRDKASNNEVHLKLELLCIISITTVANKHCIHIFHTTTEV